MLILRSYSKGVELTLLEQLVHNIPFRGVIWNRLELKLSHFRSLFLLNRKAFSMFRHNSFLPVILNTSWLQKGRHITLYIQYCAKVVKTRFAEIREFRWTNCKLSFGTKKRRSFGGIYCSQARWWIETKFHSTRRNFASTFRACRTKFRFGETKFRLG